jgi:hypothetical protein
MRSIILIIVAACSLVVGRMFAAPAATQPAAATRKAAETSPHAEALRLVSEKAGERIRALDREHWWHDVKPRQWTAKRPFHPGVIDSTHLFDVSYRIDGKVFACWSVDTRAGTVKEAPTALAKNLGI